MSIDLHIHTTASDGSHTPTEIVRLAARKGLKAIAITDHDTIDGIDEAVSEGKKVGLEVLGGLELSVKLSEVNIHLLGYLFDKGDNQLLAALGEIQDARQKRNQQILKELQSLDFPIESTELQRISTSGQTGRPHIAKLLINKKVVATMDEAFEKYLGQGAVAYVPRKIYDVEDAIQIIKNAGGVAVVAHPFQIEKSGEDTLQILEKLITLGLDGVEVYYPNHSKSFKKQLLSYAKKRSLLVTGGSDYHGDIRPGTSLAGGKNVSVPYELLEILKNYKYKKK